MHPTVPPPHGGRRRGQALVELALMLLLIAVVILATLVRTDQSVREVFTHASCALSSGSCAPTAGTGSGGAGLPAAPTLPVGTGGGSSGGGGGPPTHPTPAAVPPHTGVCPVRNPFCTP